MTTGLPSRRLVPSRETLTTDSVTRPLRPMPTRAWYTPALDCRSRAMTCTPEPPVIRSRLKSNCTDTSRTVVLSQVWRMGPRCTSDITPRPPAMAVPARPEGYIQGLPISGLPQVTAAGRSNESTTRTRLGWLEKAVETPRPARSTMLTATASSLRHVRVRAGDEARDADGSSLVAGGWSGPGRANGREVVSHSRTYGCPDRCGWSCGEDMCSCSFSRGGRLGGRRMDRARSAAHGHGPPSGDGDRLDLR